MYYQNCFDISTRPYDDRNVVWIKVTHADKVQWAIVAVCETMEEAEAVIANFFTRKETEKNIASIFRVYDDINSLEKFVANY